MSPDKKKWFQFVVSLVVCLFVRLIPFRAPNIEPILAVAMPFSKAYGRMTAFLFAFSSIIVYDLSTGTLGAWTILTSLSYGIVGLSSAYFFKNRKATTWNFIGFAVAGTLFFDAVTGLLTGPLFFGQSFYSALVGQVPFTILHLVGNVALVFILSPALYHILIRKKKKQSDALITSVFHPKTT